MPLSRKKACAHCREAKLRCNLRRPICSRCSERNILCSYDSPRGWRNAVRDSSGSSWEHPRLAQSEWDSEEGRLDAPISQPLPGVPHSSLDVTLPAESGFDLDWYSELGDGSAMATELCGFSGAASSLSTLNCSDSWPAHDKLVGSVGLGHQEELLQLDIEDADHTENNELRDSSNNRALWKVRDQSLQQKPILQGCVLNSIIIGQIMSWPRMMTTGDRLPPFIHAPCHIDIELSRDCGKAGRHHCLPKDLAICASLVDMFYSRSDANADFVWEMIYSEQVKIMNECSSLSTVDQLPGLQSLVVYMILQAQDARTADRNGAQALLKSVLTLASAAYVQQNWREGIGGSRPLRNDWIVWESFRRIFALLGIVELMYDGFMVPFTYNATETYAGFRALPLSSPRTLWEARTTAEWIGEYDAYAAKRTTTRVLTTADLLELEEAGCLTRGERSGQAAAYDVVPDVFYWCQSIDALGTLIWMVLPFAQWLGKGSKGCKEVGDTGGLQAA